MTLAELRAELTDDVLQRAETLSWPNFEMSAIGRLGYVSGNDGWRALCPAMSFSDLRRLETALRTWTPRPVRRARPHPAVALHEPIQ
jgi:hypothetical protein